jgi:Fungal N-terminal domain of STAND proteins
MDPLSGIAGAFGIADVAIRSIRDLIHEINAIQDAPEVIADLRSELTAVEAILKTLNEALNGPRLGALKPDVKSALQLAIANCKRACDKFSKRLKKWTKHSGDRIHWLDRVRVGLFAETAIEALGEQLNNCKSTVNAAVSTATLYVELFAPTRDILRKCHAKYSLFNRLTTAASAKVTDDIKTGLQTKEVEISQEIVETDEQIAEVDMMLQKLSVAQATDNEDDENDRAEAIEQLQGQRTALSASRKVLEGLVSETHHMRTGQRISAVDMSDGGKLLVGLINTDGGGREISQDIHDIKATKGGKGVVGIAQGFDVKSFFKD